MTHNNHFGHKVKHSFSLEVIMNKNNSFILKDKKSTYIDADVKIGKNVIIYGNNTIEKGSIIQDNVTLLPGNFISASTIGKGSKVHASVIESSQVGTCCLIGPYAHLRPNTIIKNNVKIGNFCELKNSIINDNTKISHLAYVGDSTIGKNCNIGCGAIFVNYNGKAKFKTFVGDNCFIGSNVNIIAPVTIANKSYICAGTTIDKSTKEYDFVIGRAQNITKSNYSGKYLED